MILPSNNRNMASPIDRFKAAQDFIQDHTGEELRGLGPSSLMTLVVGLTPEQMKAILFMKNVKIFGGINPYVEDFFSRGTIDQIVRMPAGITRTGLKLSTIFMLQNMIADPALSVANKGRVNAALTRLEGLAEGGAYRRRKTRRLTRRRRS
jgi:hypothetical protein